MVASAGIGAVSSRSPATAARDVAARESLREARRANVTVAGQTEGV
jgi:hypothetical protein